MAALRLLTRSNICDIFRHGTRPPASTGIVEVQKKWSSFRTSPSYNPSIEYTDYDISKDPKEWMYVERLIKYKQIPVPPKNLELPSGYRPATANPKDYVYFVQRTKNHMQPVYLKITFHGTRRLTHLRKIQGDIWTLEKELKQYIYEKTGTHVATRTNELVGDIFIRGDFVSRVKEWLDMKGF